MQAGYYFCASGEMGVDNSLYSVLGRDLLDLWDSLTYSSITHTPAKKHLSVVLEPKTMERCVSKLFFGLHMQS